MTDLAVWRNPDGFVVRVYGSEVLLSDSDLTDFAINLRKVVAGEINEWLGEEYQAICDGYDRRKSNEGVNLLKKLGLLKEIQAEEGL